VLAIISRVGKRRRPSPLPGTTEPNERLIVQVDHLDHIGRDMIAAINLQSHFLIEDRACF
jgi:hypothetical protein